MSVSFIAIAKACYGEAHKDSERDAGSTDTAQLFDTFIELSSADRFGCDEREISMS